MIDIRSLRDIARLYFIFRREFWLACAATALLIVLGAFVLPPKYVSEARLLVKPGRENLTVPIDVADRQTLYTQSTTRDPIIDEEKMLTGRPVLLQVARLYLAELNQSPVQAGPLAQIKGGLGKAKRAVSRAVSGALALVGLTELQSEEEETAELLASRFAVTHGPGSNVMELSFTWRDPQQAQRVLQTWVRVYLDERATVLSRNGLVAFYEAKVRDADQQIDSAKSLLHTRLAQINGTSAQERLDTLTRRLNDVRVRMAEMTAERSALQNGIQYASGRAKALPKEAVSEREMSQSATWQAMAGQLADLRRQRADALRIYKEGAPAIKALNESIATLEVQLKDEDRLVQRAEKRAPSELNASMERSQLDKSVRLQEVNTLYAAFDKEAKDIEVTRRHVLESEPELARLEQGLSVAEKSRGLYLDSLEKARIDQALDDKRINNIATIEAATLNPSRTSPKSLLLLLLALPAGALVGLLVVYLCALLDQRIHDGGGFEARFGVPLWSSVKDTQGLELDNDFHASLYRIYGALPLARLAKEGLVLGLTSARSGEGVSFLVTQLQTLLAAQGVTVRLNPSTVSRTPGELVLLEASDLSSNRQAFVQLSQADLIVLVVEARASTVPVVDNALGILRTAFHKVDGVILNRRHFEVPPQVLRWLQR